MQDFDSTLLLEVALDLANSINNDDRFDRLLASIRKAIKCDAVALLGLHDNLLTPLAIQGLSSEVLGRRFHLSEHPRLQQLCNSSKPLIFPDNCDLPDPYDGLLLARSGDLPVHSCMGLPLYSDQKVIGLVTIDSLQAGSFNQISPKTLELIAALSAATLKTALEFKKLEISAQHANQLVQELTQEALLKDGGELIGQSHAMQTLKNEIQLVAGSDYTVLITGETGVGKELVARTVHQLSLRKDKPLVHINCASLPESLSEAELFGHTKGAFTGADRERAGKFQLAHGGSLFLDEVGELPLAVQSKLLRVLQSGEIQPVGKDNVEQVDVRVIAATNRNLEEEVSEGRFRADLYHRLSVYPIKVPPLKDRDQDVLLLAGYFLEKTSRKLGIRQLRLSQDAELALREYHWPGNVRELEHVISRASLKAKAKPTTTGIISLNREFLELPTSNISVNSVEKTTELKPMLSPGMDLKTATNEFQKQCILTAVTQADGNWSEAARSLKTDRANLVRMAKRLGISIKKSVVNH
ncbi:MULTISPECIES: nitric oxide reductase transcriptional regulator NorR [unclassified Methylophaga]|jgi:anaerobic nitric oxide reductase transcription regulator|uniref:nitric oxide reductase transcriptional regulator NorR n=3 Tax=Methylophaga TaxID=40222 RepID=UPI000C993712|nr:MULTISPECIES: nitric oxide reductase transcriptional regulator NorR [unclassified Methylophaga]MAK65485.1 nitric oxide reductase transcriptional regulator NorR [Methylophaga sp.]MAY16208.1 nitric oxide reductase transcriptional regulator NorR [Methylophaga sp.]|tara:strand:- start:1303 stop:2880 length:1578 start_codon:yes stop_codon:yes gene_type:complete